jgi:hypothetical protein
VARISFIVFVVKVYDKVQMEIVRKHIM